MTLKGICVTSQPRWYWYPFAFLCYNEVSIRNEVQSAGVVYLSLANLVVWPLSLSVPRE